MAHGHKGKGTLLHLLIDGLGNPLAITTTAANGAGREEVEKLTARIKQARKLSERMTVLEADKGYDADWLRQTLLKARIFPLIPYRKIRGRCAPTMQEVSASTISTGDPSSESRSCRSPATLCFPEKRHRGSMQAASASTPMA